MADRRDTRLLRRAKPTRLPGKTLLIVCEGEKTEPNYFSFYKESLRLSNVDVVIYGAECGTDPLSVVKYAAEKFKDRSIDMCFSVIDRDRHDGKNFKSAQDLAATIKSRNLRRTFDLIVSDPSIEYWFILHHTYSRAPFVEEGSRSRGDCAAKKLGELMVGGYQKGDPDLGRKLDPLYDKALINARRSTADAEATGEYNPSTRVHEVVAALRGLIAKAK